MTYTIGNRRINLDHPLPEEEKVLLINHQKVFRFCLNTSAIKYLEELKNIVTLYADIFTIYGTLLSKIPDYDDITIITNKTKGSLLKCERQMILFMNELKDLKSNDYKRFVSSYARMNNLASILIPRILKCLSGINVFFESFENLKKLLIPFLLEQSTEVQNAIKKSCHLFGISFDFEPFTQVTPAVIHNLKKMEKVTTAFERETMILKINFDLFNPNISRYSKSLLGKAILKRDIPLDSCGLVARREICEQAAEQIISIPLATDKPDKNLYNLLYYAATFFLLFVSFLLCRLIGILKT